MRNKGLSRRLPPSRISKRSSAIAAPRLNSLASQLEVLEERSLLAVTALGNESLVNTTVANDQRTVAIGSNPTATQIVMAWTSVGEDATASDGVYAQRFDLNGSKIGAPFRVANTASGNQNAPAVALDSLGNFVITWVSSDGSSDGIYARRFAFDATPLANEFRVNTTTTGAQQAPTIAMNDAGAFAIAFQSASRDPSGNAVVARVYSAAGTALANDFQVNQFTTGNQQAPSIAMAASGQFIVSWQSAGQDPSGDAVVARRYGSTGTALANEFVVNQTVSGNQNNPSIAANADGSFVIAWQSASQDGSGDAIVARRYDTTGTALANEFIVNQFTSGNQSSPSVASVTGSGFVITWQSALQDGNSDAVVARQYTAAGVAAGNEFVANTFTSGAQNNPAVGMQADGDFVLAWQSPGQETGGSTSLGIFARRYNVANDAPVMKQISNQITDVGGTIAFTAQATDQDSPVDTLTYSLVAGSPAGLTINPTIGAVTWNTVGVTPGRYFVTIEAHDQAGLVDDKQVAMTVFAPGERTALDDYVNTPDPAYKWDIRGRTVGDGYTKYDIRLTSGTWRTAAEVNTPLWQHWMEVYVPDVITKSRALLFIDGGSNSSTPPVSSDIDAYAGLVASSTGSVMIDLFSIPSEPLQFAGESFTRSEDSIIAYSWRKYLETGDPTWPVNLAMTRAAMRAMDAVSDFISSPVGGNVDIGSFVVTGGSKRGWTTWLASATDPRVSEAIPIVSDLLNMEESFVHHYAYYDGAFSAAVQDYVNEGILDINRFGTDGIDTLLSIVDPYTYLNRLTLPKYIVNVGNDEFFVPDSWKFYYDALPGPKSIRYLPNSSHGISDPIYIGEALGVFGSIDEGEALPVYNFHQLEDGTIELQTNETVVDAKLWKATNTTKRDFRWPVVGADYTSTPLVDQGGGVYRANVPTPVQGWTAYFIEISTENDLGVIKVTSGIYIKGPPVNVQPTLVPIDDVVVNEGSPLTLPVSASDPDVLQSLAYELNAGAPAQVSIDPHTGVVSGLWNDQLAGGLDLTVTVWDNGPPPLPDRSTFHITVLNVAPTAALNGPSTGNPGQTLTYTLGATDPSSVDQAAGFTFKIDWDGDGNIDQTVLGPSGTTVTHAFASGTNNVRVTATDKDGGTSTAATQTVVTNRPPVAPGSFAPFTVAEGGSLVLTAIGWTDPDGNPLTYTWDVDGDGQYDDAAGSTATLTWNDLAALGLDDNGLFHVSIRVDDGQGGVTLSGPIALTITNTAPTAVAGGPYIVSEGGSLALSATGSDPAGAKDPLTYSWDINGDGLFGDAAGQSPSLNWSQLAALGISNGPSLFNVRVRVSDDDGGSTDSDPASLTVNNAPPTASVSGPASALRGEKRDYVLTAVDPSNDDQFADFAFNINWGDGTAQLITAASGNTVSHAFNTAGLLTVTITATDIDGAVSVVSSKNVQVDAVQLRPNADNTSLTDLVWGGSLGADSVAFDQQGTFGIRVRELMINGATVNNSQDFPNITGRVIALGSNGNDQLDARGISTRHVTLNGNAGNNTLYGGNGGDLLIGGSNGGEGRQGNNVIIAGNGDNTIYGTDVTARKKASGGNNIIIGGTGHDTIYGSFGLNPTGNGGEGGNNIIIGGGGDDAIYASQVVDGAEGGSGSILIAGRTNLGQAALQSIMSEWTSTRSLAERIANIQGPGVGPRSNGGDFLQLGVTVFNDNAPDDLYSDTNGDADWLLYDFTEDHPHRTKPADALTDMS